MGPVGKYDIDHPDVTVILMGHVPLRIGINSLFGVSGSSPGHSSDLGVPSTKERLDTQVSDSNSAYQELAYSPYYSFSFQTSKK